MPEFSPVLVLDQLDGTNGFRLDGVAPNYDTARAVSGAGDVNGDGIPDILIGARSASPNGQSSAGAAYLVFGKAGGFETAIDLGALDGADGFEIDGALAGSFVGGSVARVGDVDGDGLDDVLIGAPGYGDGGAAFLLFGDQLTTADEADGTADGKILLNGATFGAGTVGQRFLAEGPNGGDDFGLSVAGVDMNGDGFADLIFGAPDADPSSGAGNGDEGAAYVVFGGDANLEALDIEDSLDDGLIRIADLSAGQGVRLAGGTTNDNEQAGYAVATAGDVNGDGFEDVIIGGRLADPNSGGDNGNEGAAYLILGRSEANWAITSTVGLQFLNGVVGAVVEGENDSDQTGRWVDGGGDVNGDGLDDIVVAAPYADPYGTNSAGSAYVLFGRAAFRPDIEVADIDGQNGFRMNGLRGGDYTGISVMMAGDLNGDGFEDVAVAAHFFDQIGNTNAGAVFVVFGKAGGFDAEIDLGALNGDDGFRVDAGPQADILGRGLSGKLGDINGDGFDDLLVSGYRSNYAGSNSGSAFVIFGHKAESEVTRIGTNLGQTLHGGVSDDLIEGNDGDDTLFGHEGDDVISGGGDDDMIEGGDGDDDISGSSGDDVIEGGDGDDVIKGGSGADIFFGLLGRDRIDGGGGDDELDLRDVDGSVMVKLDNGKAVTSARDKAWLEGVEDVAATLGDDYLRGDDADNRLIGRAGADEIFGGVGDDALFGSTGADTLRGDEGNDNLFGSSGADDIDGGDGDDVIRAGTGDDRGGGSAGDDDIDGGDGDDLFFGNEGADLMTGGDGDDKLRGQEGDDRLDGGADDDSLRGGDGDDVIEGGDGRDTLQGEDGDDVLIGGGGRDNIFGGAGVDRFVMVDDFEFDKIFDFEDGLEFLDFRQHSTINSIDDLQIQAFGSGDTDTRIRDIADTDDFIVLENVDVSNISEADFLF